MKQGFRWAKAAVFAYFGALWRSDFRVPFEFAQKTQSFADKTDTPLLIWPHIALNACTPPQQDPPKLSYSEEKFGQASRQNGLARRRR
jgi:hypothetical protein